MNKNFTIIANAPTDINHALAALRPFITPLTIHQRADQVWDIICPPETQLTPALREKCYALQLDFALQDEQCPTKKLFLSDMDATIVVGETIDDMAEALGIYDEISAITAAAMRGEIGYRDALSQRLALLKGIPKQTIATIAENVNITEGADQLLAEINRREMNSCLISGGFTVFTYHVSQLLGFKHHLANRLAYDENDCLNGHWQGDLVSAEVKEATLKTMAKQQGITLSETVAIGDGANDHRMIKHAGLGVAFYGKPMLREVADAEIHSGTIDHLIWFL